MPPAPEGVEVVIECECNQHHGFELAVRLQKDKKQVGEIECSPLIHGIPEKLGRGCYELGWIETARTLREKGLGRYLVARTGFEMLERGYPHCIVGTNLASFGSIAFYTNTGFELTDVAYSDLLRERETADGKWYVASDAQADG